MNFAECIALNPRASPRRRLSSSTLLGAVQIKNINIVNIKKWLGSQ
jgi:hypothetical protein